MALPPAPEGGGGGAAGGAAGGGAAGGGGAGGGAEGGGGGGGGASSASSHADTCVTGRTSSCGNGGVGGSGGSSGGGGGGVGDAALPRLSRRFCSKDCLMERRRSSYSASSSASWASSEIFKLSSVGSDMLFTCVGFCRRRRGTRARKLPTTVHVAGEFLVLINLNPGQDTRALDILRRLGPKALQDTPSTFCSLSHSRPPCHLRVLISSVPALPHPPHIASDTHARQSATFQSQTLERWHHAAVNRLCGHLTAALFYALVLTISPTRGNFEPNDGFTSPWQGWTC